MRLEAINNFIVLKHSKHLKKTMMKLSAITVFATSLLIVLILTSTHLYAGKKIIKWVDSNGVTHYGDKPPMPGKTNQSTELNQYGVAIDKTNHDAKTESVNHEEVAGSEAQKRRDNALLSSFASIEEIEIARKRNIKIDTLALESLQQKQATMKARIAESKQSNSAEISGLQNIELRIKLKEKAIAVINKRYEQDKLRYLELTSPTKAK